MTEKVDEPEDDDPDHQDGAKIDRSIATRFQEGRSGNPRGRPRKNASEPTHQGRADLTRALAKKVKMRDGDRVRTMTRLQAGYEQLAIAHAKGDRHARREITELAQHFGIDIIGLAKEMRDEELEPSEQEILDHYVARRNGETMASETRVYSEPELAEHPDAPEATLAEASAPTRPHHVLLSQHGDGHAVRVIPGGPRGRNR